MKKSNIRGITLIALVITIIILLILAGISVAVMTGENGIINKANIAKEITKIEEYREDLQLIGEGLQPDKVIEQLSSKEYMDRYEEEIKKDERYEKVKRKDEETIIVTSKEGYVYKITTEKVEYIGKEGEITPPDLQESDIVFKNTPTKWTNKEVTVEIEKKNEEIKEFILQHSIDGITWKNYTEPIIVKDNGAVYARLVNNIGDTGGYATGNIENIDKLAPNNFTPTTTSTTNSITLTGSTQDQEKTETDGSSGIAKYYFSNDNGSTWLPTNGQTGTSYTFSNLTQNKTYSLKMKAIDNAGNETTTETVSKETGTVPGLIESNITFTNNPSTWTKGSVNVTISTTVTGYTLQYSTDGSNWNNYTAAINRTDNGAIYARLWDGTNAGGYATGNVENIDRLEPNTFTPTATSTSSSITLTGSTTDKAKTTTNGSSGIAKYYFSNDNGATWLPTNGQTTTSYTFSNLTQNKTYSLKMKAVDNAGNETTTETVSKETGTVPGLIENNITFTNSPSTWTKGSVNVTISTTVTGYTLQYSTNGTNWNNYTTPINRTDNGAIYARLWDGTNAGGYATGNVENIDRLEPNTFTPTATSTTNSITLTGSTTDQAKTATNGSSGIAKYYFSMDNGATWLPTNGQTTTSYTFSKLTQNKTYSLKMKAVDNAGNETVTSTVSKETGTVPGLIENNITFTNSPSTWTKGSVNVTISTTVTGYTLQYSTDGSNWNNYTAAINRTDNGAIYARLWDGTNAGGYATGNVENIDRLEPNTFTPTATSTTNSITLTGSTTDQAKTATNGSSGITKYYFSNDNGSTWEPENGQTGTSYTFSNLTQNKTYSLKMKAVDNAGNEIITSTVSKGTGTVPGLIESNITFTNNPSTWTKGSVNVTISTTVTGYMLQYSTDGSNWNNYTAAINRTDNGAIYARLWDGTNAGGYATGNVTNIDKIAPTVSVSASSRLSDIIDLTVTASDAESGLSTNETYKYYLGNILKATSTTNSYTFTGLSPETSYIVKVVVIDKVGNTTEKSATLTTTYLTKPFSPTGSSIINNNLSTGYTMKDSNNNEWVWIEVPRVSTLYTTAKSRTDYTNIEKDMQNYAKDYRQDGYADTFYSTEQHGFANATEYNNWKNDMLESVFTNGGFYIGRYEMGTETARFSASDSLTTPLIKQDMYPYNYITCSQAHTLAKQLSTGGKQASLMFGIQWDLVMKFIETKGGKTQEELKTNSGTWGNFRDVTFDVTRGKYLKGTWNNITTTYTKPASAVLLSTGATTRNSTLNIYDLAGNVWEWTLEKTSNISRPCVGCGGYCNYSRGSLPATARTASSTDNSLSDLGARQALW